MHLPRKFHPSRRGGFTLVELLVVISIFTIMTLLVGPAVTSLFQSEGFTGNVSEIEYIFKQARAKAMAQNTFVWLGFSATTANGSPSLIASAVAGGSGLSSDLSNGYYVPVMKPMVLRNLRIVSSSSNSSILNLTGFNTTNNTDLSTYASPYSSTTFGSTFGTAGIVVFSPDGEMTLDTAKMFQCIGIGLQAGPVSATHSQVAAIQVAGLCGQPTIFRQ